MWRCFETGMRRAGRGGLRPGVRGGPRHHAGRPRLDLPDRWSTPRWVPVRSGDRAGQSPHRVALHIGPGPRPAQLLPHAAVLSVVGELADPRDVVLRRRNGRDGDHEATLSGDGRPTGRDYQCWSAEQQPVPEPTAIPHTNPPSARCSLPVDRRRSRDPATQIPRRSTHGGPARAARRPDQGQGHRHHHPRTTYRRNPPLPHLRPSNRIGRTRHPGGAGGG